MASTSASSAHPSDTRFDVCIRGAGIVGRSLALFGSQRRQFTDRPQRCSRLLTQFGRQTIAHRFKVLARRRRLHAYFENAH